MTLGTIPGALLDPCDLECEECERPVERVSELEPRTRGRESVGER